VTSLSTDSAATGDAVSQRVVAYHAAEEATLTPYGEWAEVKDAMQTSLMWSMIYDPKEGLVAPVTRNWRFAGDSPDGDENYVLFCWDGSFASYMLSLDAPDLAISNLVQIVKMRTSAGFIPSFASGTRKTRDRSNPPVTSKVLLEMLHRWGSERMGWVVELLFDDLYTWNSWMWLRRREAPVGLLSWGSDPFPYAPDGKDAAQGAGNYGATLESGLDNGPVMLGVPFNQTGLYLQDEYDAGYTGMYLMDCRALKDLAQHVGRQDAIDELDRRFQLIDSAMQVTLWDENRSAFVNKLSANEAIIDTMAPTHFYPLLAGTSTASQVEATVVRHLTNASRFAVWPSASPPDPAPPPAVARPITQWAKGQNHTLCVRAACNWRHRSHLKKISYEGMGLAAPPTDEPGIGLYVFACPGGVAGHDVDEVLAPLDWQPSVGHCRATSDEPELWVLPRRSRPELVELQLWYSAAAGDHWPLASEASKIAAAAAGYAPVASLGFVWPAPGTQNATSLYPLPSVAKDDHTYLEQNYWRGRIWSPMLQIVYWALREYTDVPVAAGAADGLVVQSKALLLHEWRGCEGVGRSGLEGTGRYVYENFDADTAEGYGYTSESQSLYSWGALAGSIGLQHNGFYEPVAEALPALIV